MIEITKQNETFQLKESTDNGWAMSGSASKEVSGSYSINFSVTKPGELSEYIGDCSYHKPSEDGQVSISYTVSEQNRDALVAYSDTVLDAVLAKFQEQ